MFRELSARLCLGLFGALVFAFAATVLDATVVVAQKSTGGGARHRHCELRF